jgi:diacylglycerol kinase family enzyme
VRRVLAIISLTCIALLVALFVVIVVSDFLSVLLAVVGLAVGAWGGWWVITERMPRRAMGAVGLVAGLGILVASIAWAVDDAGRAWVVALVVLVLVAGALACARGAVAATLTQIDLESEFPSLRPRHAVLICNPKSGGGKVDRFQIVEKARAAGVEVVLLEPGMDLEQLARDAVARGADCLGMAGGDGSQALVASIAVEHGLPFVCISAGTRNHFALDLGLDRNDPSTGLAAFTDGVVRRVDVAWVGDRLFVNNVSLGVYADIVEHDSYRDAKLATTAETLPELLGRTAEPFDLQFTDPSGQEVDGSFVILVSNNPYVLGPNLDVSQRRSLTTGELGVFAVTAKTGAEAAALVARSAIGLGAADPNLHQFTTGSFEIRSRSGTAAAGVDGEALTLDTPLRFTIKHRGLQVLVPPDNPAVTITKHYRSLGVRGLWDIAMGRTPALPVSP